MFNYYFRPLAEHIAETKLAVEGQPDTVLVSVKAADEKSAREIAESVINMANWELDHVADV